MVEGVDRMKDVAEARHSGITSGHRNGSITAFLGKIRLGKDNFSHQQHTKIETKFVDPLAALR